MKIQYLVREVHDFPICVGSRAAIATRLRVPLEEDARCIDDLERCRALGFRFDAREDAIQAIEAHGSRDTQYTIVEVFVPAPTVNTEYILQ